MAILGFRGQALGSEFAGRSSCGEAVDGLMQQSFPVLVMVFFMTGFEGSLRRGCTRVPEYLTRIRLRKPERIKDMLKSLQDAVPGVQKAVRCGKLHAARVSCVRVESLAERETPKQKPKLIPQPYSPKSKAPYSL